MSFIKDLANALLDGVLHYISIAVSALWRFALLLGGIAMLLVAVEQLPGWCLSAADKRGLADPAG